MKLLSLLIFSGLAFAQPPTLIVQAENYGSMSFWRQVLPLGAPSIEVWIYDSVLTDTGYKLTLTYTTADGVQHAAEPIFVEPGYQINESGNRVTPVSIAVDAVTASVQVSAQTATGVTAQTVAQ